LNDDRLLSLPDGRPSVAAPFVRPVPVNRLVATVAIQPLSSPTSRRLNRCRLQADQLAKETELTNADGRKPENTQHRPPKVTIRGATLANQSAANSPCGPGLRRAAAGQGHDRRHRSSLRTSLATFLDIRGFPVLSLSEERALANRCREFGEMDAPTPTRQDRAEIPSLWPADLQNWVRGQRGPDEGVKRF
jgi:hypothetical protein